VVDADADATDRKLMLAAAEKHLPQLLAARAEALVASELGELALDRMAARRRSCATRRWWPASNGRGNPAAFACNSRRTWPRSILPSERG
jgi:hypothetical protein